MNRANGYRVAKTDIFRQRQSLETDGAPSLQSANAPVSAVSKESAATANVLAHIFTQHRPFPIVVVTDRPNRGRRYGMRGRQKLLPQFKSYGCFRRHAKRKSVRSGYWSVSPCGITNQARRFSQAAALYRRERSGFTLRQGGRYQISSCARSAILSVLILLGGGLPCGDIEAERQTLRHDVFQCFTFFIHCNEMG